MITSFFKPKPGESAKEGKAPAAAAPPSVAKRKDATPAAAKVDTPPEAAGGTPAAEAQPPGAHASVCALFPHSPPRSWLHAQGASG